MRKCRIYLLDDDLSVIEYLKGLVNKTYHEVVGYQTNPIKALKEIPKLNVDILFLDMQMQPLSGMDVMPQLPEHIRVIFSSSYRELAAEGYETYFRHYLLKPFNFQQFCAVLNQTIATLPNISALGDPWEDEQVIFYKQEVKGNHVAIRIEDVAFGHSIQERNIAFHLDNGEVIEIKRRIGEIMKGLPKSRFARVSKSTFVALHKIERIKNGKVIVKQGDTRKAIDLGLGFAKDLHNWVEERSR